VGTIVSFRDGREREPRPAATPPEIAACLATGRDAWIFGYGSLMWDPGFPYCEAVPGVLRGYHRRFCVYSHDYRGTPERPGLVLGLDRGGMCKGVAFRIPAVDVETALHDLWDREMRQRIYRLRELSVALEGRTVHAYAFVVDATHPAYAGRLSLDDTARLIHGGVGGRGPCRDYLASTVRQLEELGMLDGPLHRLERRVKELAEAGLPN
jgi:cation transport protein ChaC